MLQAKRDVSDRSAAESLRLEISDIGGDVLDREIGHWVSRENYLDDRAFRLLVAAREGDGLVAPIDPEKHVRFEQEATLGRLPMADAFARLADVEPELGALKESALRKKVRSRDLSSLVGPGARRPNPVLSSDTAMKIALIYLGDCARGRDGDPRSYFDRVGRTSRVSIGVRPPGE
jgi:hypothetical protein